MPVRYRRYYLQRLTEILEKQQENINSKFNLNNTDQSQPNKSSKEKPPIPDFAFNAKAPKK
jgi:hypothetical protein